jgi:hypothetical protein
MGKEVGSDDGLGYVRYYEAPREVPSSWFPLKSSSSVYQRPSLHAQGDMSVFLYASPPNHQSPRAGDVGALHGNLPQVTQILIKNEQ